MTKRKLTLKEIEKALGSLTDWTCVENRLEKKFVFNDFAQALDFVNKVGELAERTNHHPDIQLSWGKVQISLSTHSIGGITQKDVDLAKEINDLR